MNDREPKKLQKKLQKIYCKLFREPRTVGGGTDSLQNEDLVRHASWRQKTTDFEASRIVVRDAPLITLAYNVCMPPFRGDEDGRSGRSTGELGRARLQRRLHRVREGGANHPRRFRGHLWVSALLHQLREAALIVRPDVPCYVSRRAVM